MDSYLLDKLDRSELAPFEGMEMCFIGTITNTSAPTPNKRFACISNAIVAVRDDNTPFRDRTHMKFPHMWLDVTDVSWKPRLTDSVIGSGTVMAYTRKDGTQSYCLRFKEKGLTETGLMYSFKEHMDALRMESSGMTLAEQHECVTQLMVQTEEFVRSGKVCFFDQTPATFLASMHAYKNRIMHACGVYLPNNRSGRRYHGEFRRSRHHKAPSTRGFG